MRVLSIVIRMEGLTVIGKALVGTNLMDQLEPKCLKLQLTHGNVQPMPLVGSMQPTLIVKVKQLMPKSVFIGVMTRAGGHLMFKLKIVETTSSTICQIHLAAHSGTETKLSLKLHLDTPLIMFTYIPFLDIVAHLNEFW